MGFPWKTQGRPEVPKCTWGLGKPGSPFTAFGFLVPSIRCTGTLSSTSFAFVFLYVYLRGVCTCVQARSPARLCEFQRLASGILPLPGSILVFETQFLIVPGAWLLVYPPPSPMDSDWVHPGDRCHSWPLHGYQGLDSGPHIYTASSLSTEPSISPPPPLCFLKCLNRGFQMGSRDEFGTGWQNLRGKSVSVSFSRMLVLRACPFFQNVSYVFSE